MDGATHPSADSPLAPVVHRAVQAAIAAGRETYGTFRVGRDDFAAHVTTLTYAKLARFGLEPTPERVAKSLEAAVGADLYLAAACNAGDELAWQVLHDRFEARLLARVVRQGARGAKPRRLVADLFGDLALPAPKGRARTLIGTFDGSGSLLGWLTTIVSRRHGRGARPAAVVTLEEGRDEAAPVQPRRSTASARDPLEAVAGRDAATAFREAFERAWDTLNERERLVLVLKHRDGRRQREIAGALGITESAISRHVSRAVAKLRLGLRAVPAPDGSGDGMWAALGLAVSEKLSSSRAADALQSEDTEDPEADSP
ncbi:MAG: sigma-70 family RNA polymerase sigma factor [Planctomycetota bacterium]|nr:sigma-70 family RNA polymerase sigma factor [Planctomycetota bacterium]